MSDSETMIRPMNGHVLVEVLEDAPQETPGGLLIPDTAKGRKRYGLVIAVGRGREHKGNIIPPDVKPGDLVLFDPYKIRAVLADGTLAQAPGTPVAQPGERFIIHEHDIVAVTDVPDDAPTWTELRWAFQVLRRAVRHGTEGPRAVELNESLNTLQDGFPSHD